MVEEPDLLLDLEDLQSKDEGVCPGEQLWLVQGQARSLGRGCGLDQCTTVIVKIARLASPFLFSAVLGQRGQGTEGGGERGRDFLCHIVRMPPCESVPFGRIFATCETRRKRLGET